MVSGGAGQSGEKRGAAAVRVALRADRAKAGAMPAVATAAAIIG